MGRPSFIIVGAERCGTTSIYHNICKHTQVYPAYTKEIEFFDRYYDRGKSWYHEQFDDLDGITGEGTPTYFWNPIVARRIYRYNPDIKIIITLRDKESAIKSKWKQQVVKGIETLCFEDALQMEPIRIKGEMERVQILPYNYYPSLYVDYAYRDRYNYEKHLSKWDVFNKLVITDYFGNEDKSMENIFMFLGLKPEKYEWEILNQSI